MIPIIRFRAQAADQDPATLATFDYSILGDPELPEYGPAVRILPTDHEFSRARWHPWGSGQRGVRCEAPLGDEGEGDPGGDCSKCPQRLIDCSVSHVFIGQGEVYGERLYNPEEDAWRSLDEPFGLTMSFKEKPLSARQHLNATTVRMLMRAIKMEVPLVIYGVQATTKSGVVYGSMRVEA